MRGKSKKREHPTRGTTHRKGHKGLEQIGDPRESGSPGGGGGRRDEVGPTGVYPMSGGIPKGKHLEIRTPAAWGQGERGAAGYDDSGGSELVYRDGQLLGGTTAGPSGEPTIDIHGGKSQTHPEDTTELRRPTTRHRKRNKKR